MVVQCPLTARVQTVVKKAQIEYRYRPNSFPNEGGGSPTWEKFPHFPVFLMDVVPYFELFVASNSAIVTVFSPLGLQLTKCKGKHCQYKTGKYLRIKCSLFKPQCADCDSPLTISIYLSHLRSQILNLCPLLKDPPSLHLTFEVVYRRNQNQSNQSMIVSLSGIFSVCFHFP